MVWRTWFVVLFNSRPSLKISEISRRQKLEPHRKLLAQVTHYRASGTHSDQRAPEVVLPKYAEAMFRVLHAPTGCVCANSDEFVLLQPFAMNMAVAADFR
jgi:hypothetical protein